jgi:atypical dual specificity phosphatase
MAEDHGESTGMQDGFSWVIDQRLAGMPRPGASTSLEDDAAFLAEQGIDLLISLTGGIPNPTVLADFEIELYHLPIEDFHPPTLSQQIEFVEKTAQALENGGRVGVHCAAGVGRTGTMLATYLVYLGRTAEDAIARVRVLRPGSIETVAQEASVKRYYEYLKQDRKQ